MDTDPTTVPGINVIPESRWKEGIPPVMGAHLMDSGAVSASDTSAVHDDMHSLLRPASEHGTTLTACMVS